MYSDGQAKYATKESGTERKDRKIHHRAKGIAEAIRKEGKPVDPQVEQEIKRRAEEAVFKAHKS